VIPESLSYMVLATLGAYGARLNTDPARSTRVERVHIVLAVWLTYLSIPMHTDPVIGLYSAAVGPFLFAAFGSARHLSVGPISLASIYIPIALRAVGFDIADASAAAKDLRAEAAVALTFYVFCIFLVMSLLRLGLLIRFVSHSVMTGFVTAAGIYVMISELKCVLWHCGLLESRIRRINVAVRQIMAHMEFDPLE
jgi:MFS superfamily sulfate permease-like transporter